MSDEIENGTIKTDEIPETVRANLDSISDDIHASAPAPNMAAIDADKEQADEQKAENAHLRDADNAPFDPDMHVTDADGQPKLTSKGKLRKRPGRKAGSVSGGRKASAGGSKISTGDHSNALHRQQARMSGTAAANALVMFGVVMGGNEWAPMLDEREGLDERAQLQTAFGDYFEAKEMHDIPPGVALSIALVAYAAPRFTMPQTKSKMQKLKEWVAVKIAKRKVRKNGAQSDIGNDGKRQNNAGEKTSK